jgi:hypothetical protein
VQVLLIFGAFGTPDDFADISHTPESSFTLVSLDLSFLTMTEGVKGHEDACSAVHPASTVKKEILIFPPPNP